MKDSQQKTRSIVRFTDAHKIAFQYNKFKRFKLRENLEMENSRENSRKKTSRNEKQTTPAGQKSGAS